MIPFTEIKTKKKICHFIHANGYPPLAYEKFLKFVSTDFSIKSMICRSLWNSSPPPKNIHNWDIFVNTINQYKEFKSIELKEAVQEGESFYKLTHLLEERQNIEFLIIEIERLEFDNKKKRI